MCAVAKRRSSCLLALTEGPELLLLDCELQWCDRSPDVGIVAKGLIGRSAAAAPEVGARLELEFDRLLVGNNGFVQRFSFLVPLSRCQYYEIMAMKSSVTALVPIIATLASNLGLNLVRGLL